MMILRRQQVKLLERNFNCIINQNIQCKLKFSSSSKIQVESSQRQRRKSNRQDRLEIFHNDKSIKHERDPEGNQNHRVQYNEDPFSLKPSEDHYTFPLVDSNWLEKQETRPKKVRMLARDFIHDSLYNPNYGYFSRHAVLLRSEKDNFDNKESFNFSNFKNEKEFMISIQQRYQSFEESIEKNTKSLEKQKNELKLQMKQLVESISKNKNSISSTKNLSEEELNSIQQEKSIKLNQATKLRGEIDQIEHDFQVKSMVERQIWHTPTELFKPFYAFSIAEYIIKNMKVNEPLVIYEVGAGSGSLSNDILNFIKENHSNIYNSMSYNIIEISKRLSQQQQEVLKNHINKVEIHNENILDWQKIENRNCFFIALEVLDNFTHDVIRYSTETLKPFQCLISIDDLGEMNELYIPLEDELIKEYLEIFNSTSKGIPKWLSYLPESIRKAVTSTIPFYPNLTKGEFIPIGSFKFLKILKNQFPNHNLIISDFNYLPDSIEGINSPVVQTRLNSTMIEVSRFTVMQGFFDIFFPTNFKKLEIVYNELMKSKESKESKNNNDNKENSIEILSHKTFLQNHSQFIKTKCKDGSNPMLNWYENANWFLTRNTN